MWGRTAEGQRCDQLHFSDVLQEMYCPYPIGSADWGNTHTHPYCQSLEMLVWNFDLYLTLTFTLLDWTSVSCTLMGAAKSGCDNYNTFKIFWGTCAGICNVVRSNVCCLFCLQSLASAIAATKVLSAQQVVKNEAGEEVRSSSTAHQPLKSLNIFGSQCKLNRLKF